MQGIGGHSVLIASGCNGTWIIGALKLKPFSRNSKVLANDIPTIGIGYDATVQFC